MGMGTLDDHVPGRVHIDTWWVSRVGLHEPYDNWDIVRDSLKGHRYCSFGLEEIDGAAIVVGKSSGFRFERRIGCGERDEVLTDEPFCVLCIRKRRRATLG